MFFNHQAMRYCFMDSQWLKTQFSVHPDKTKADLAKALGLEAPAISKILGGARQIKAQEYLSMRRFFGLPVDGETAVKPSSSAYTIEPLENNPGLGEEPHRPQDDEWVIPANILNTRTQAPQEKIKKFQVRESAMEPDFKQGEHVLVDLTDQNPSPPGVFVVSDGFGYMVRRCEFIPKTNPPEIKISAKSNGFHSQTLKLGDFTIIGRVIAKLQML
jgi:hypothetical protein